MDPLTRALTVVARRGALPGPLRTAASRVIGVDQAITRRRGILSLLELDGVTVPYGTASEALGVGGFALAVDGDAHHDARARLAYALGEADVARQVGVAGAEALAGSVLTPAGTSLDVHRELVEPALELWLETWYGLPLCGPTLGRAARVLACAIFFDTDPHGTPKDEVRLGHATHVLDDIRAELAPAVAKAPKGTVAAALVDVHGGTDGAVRDLFGLTVGPLALGPWAITIAVADQLAVAPGLDPVLDLPGAAAAFSRSMGTTPPLPFILRHNDRERQVVGHDRAVELPAGSVLVATGCAMHLDGATPGTRPDLAFGAGAHSCMGQDAITEVAAVVLLALAARKPRLPVDGPRTATSSTRPDGAGTWGYPASLRVDLAPAPPTATS